VEELSGGGGLGLSAGLSASPPAPESSTNVDVGRLVEGPVEVGNALLVLQHAVDEALELGGQLGGRLELIQVNQALLADESLAHGCSDESKDQNQEN